MPHASGVAEQHHVSSTGLVIAPVSVTRTDQQHGRRSAHYSHHSTNIVAGTTILGALVLVPGVLVLGLLFSSFGLRSTSSAATIIGH